MLGMRIVLGLMMVFGYIGALIMDEALAPWYPIWFVIAAITLLSAAWEMVRLLQAGGASPMPGVVLGGVAAMILANWTPHVLLGLSTLSAPLRYETTAAHPVLSAMAWPLASFSAIVMLALMAQSGEPITDPGRAMARVGATILAVAYVGVLGSFFIQFRWLPGDYHGLIPMLALATATKGSDTGALIVGRTLGRHKLWPRISPNKTIEGAIGGQLLAMILMVVLVVILRQGFQLESLSLPHALGFGFLVGLAAQVGDLMESMIKRDAQQKDASTTIPGFGGVLDVLDSSLFSAPVAMAYWIAVA